MRIKKIKINPFVILVALIFGITGLWFELFLAWLALLGHEAGHIWVLKKKGRKLHRLEFFPFGGVAEVEGLLACRDEIEVALAGPLVSLFLAGISLLISGSYTGKVWLTVNMALFFTNLLPAYPLDGGRILRSTLAVRIGYNRATAMAVKVSRWLALVIAVISLCFFLWGRFSLLSLFLAFFVLNRARLGTEEILVLCYEDLLSRYTRMQKKPLPGEIWALDEQASLQDTLLAITPGRYHLVFVLKGQAVKGLLDDEDLQQAFLLGKLTTELGDLVEE